MDAPQEPSESDLLRLRREKLDALRAKGIDPFGGRFDTTHAPGALRGDFQPDLEVKTAGRITARRDMGKSIFFDLSDFTGRIQCYLSTKDCGPELFDLFKHQVDIGDWAGVEGRTFVTKMGEPSVHAASFTIL